MFKKLFVSLIISCSSTLAAIEPALVETITDVESCLYHLEYLLRKQIETADKARLHSARNEIDTFFAAHKAFQANKHDLQTVSWCLFPKFVQAYNALTGQKMVEDLSFNANGFTQGATQTRSLWHRFYGTLPLARKVPIYAEDHVPTYCSKHLPGYLEEQLNASNTYYIVDSIQKESIQPILDRFKETVANCIGTKWRVSNVRLWKTNLNCKECDECAWHVDLNPPSTYKLLLFPTGANTTNGTIEFMQGKVTHTIQGAPGHWVLYKCGEILYRFTPPKVDTTPMIEVTIVPALEYDTHICCAGLNATYPKLPWNKLEFPKNENAGKAIAGITLKSAKQNAQAGFVNLTNPSFHFYSHALFPFSDKCTSTFYTDKSFTHENLATIQGILVEAYRTLKDGGDFIIKLPDFDEAIKCWRADDHTFFEQAQQMENFTSLWYNKGVCDCMQHRIAAFFCCFYNDAFAPFFDSIGIDDYVAYFGPPAVDEGYFKPLLDKNTTPYELVEQLCKAIKSSENDCHLYNQTGWGRKELGDFLSRSGFEVVSFDKEKILRQFGHIKGIHDHSSHHTYCWARKR